MKRVLLRALPELAEELRGVVNVFDPWARERGEYYSLEWQSAPRRRGRRVLPALTRSVSARPPAPDRRPSRLSTSRTAPARGAPAGSRPVGVERGAVGLERAAPRRRSDGLVPAPRASAVEGRALAVLAASGSGFLVRSVEEDLGDPQPRSRALEEEPHLARRAVAERRPPAAPGGPRAARRSPTAGRRAPDPRPRLPRRSTPPTAPRAASRRGRRQRQRRQPAGGCDAHQRGRAPRASPAGEVHAVCGSRSSTAGAEALAVERRRLRSRRAEPAATRRRAAGSRGTPRTRRPASSSNAPPRPRMQLAEAARRAACRARGASRAPRPRRDRGRPRRGSAADRPGCARSRPGSRSRRPATRA